MWHKNDHKKDACLQYESWNKKALFNFGWERMCWATQIFPALCASANNHECAMSMDFDQINFNK
jgi:hypothetical protein